MQLSQNSLCSLSHSRQRPSPPASSRGEREGTRACAGRVRWAAASASRSIPPLRSTTSPSHCFAMGPTLSPSGACECADAAERDSERDVESNSEDGGGMTYVRIQYFGICSRAQLFGSHGWKHSTLPLRSQTWQRPSPALFRILFGGTTAKPLGPGLMRARHQPSSPK